MGKIMKDGIQYGVGGIQKAESITYDNTDSGMTATNVQGAVDELSSGLTDLIIKEDVVISTSFSAGTIGTRGAQYSWDNPHEHDGYKIIAMLFLYIGNSNEYTAQAFHSNGKIYCNFYRASTVASQVSATLRVVYAKI